MSDKDDIDTGDNNKDPTRESEPQNSGNKGYDDIDELLSAEQNKQSTPERWIVVLAITILAFGVILLTLRSVVFSLIFLTIGISLFAYWLYIGVRSREQARFIPGYVSNSTFRESAASERQLVCTCSICKHSDSKSCMQKRCPCCILTRNKEIIGHFSNPPQ